MARFEIRDAENGMMAAGAQADVLFELGLMYATGRDCEADIVAAHKWFNIAAIKGSDRAAQLRTELAATMEFILEALHQHSLIGKDYVEEAGASYSDIMGSMLSSLGRFSDDDDDDFEDDDDFRRYR